MTKRQINLYDLLEHLQKRRAMFLGNDHTFQSLDAFIGGFLLASNSTQIETEDFNSFSDFNMWILGYLPNHFGRTGGWYWQIKNYIKKNDDQAFEYFFECINLFKTAKKYTEILDVKPFRIQVTEFNASQKKPDLSYKLVNFMYKVTMEHSTTIWVKGFQDNELVYETWCLSEEEYWNIVEDKII